MRITIDISDRMADMLTPLASCPAIEMHEPATTHQRVTRVVEALVATAIAGIPRPGAWERNWIEQALGPVPAEWFEPDPEATWRVRVRGGLR